MLTCPITFVPDDYHFTGRCEDCDLAVLATLSLGQVEDRYNTGRISHVQMEAYRHLWGVFAPGGGQTDWLSTPIDLDVRRVARKLCRIKGLDIPATVAP